MYILNGKSSVIWQRICGFSPPNYKRTEDLSDIDSVASSVHSTPPSSWWSEAQRCRQFPRCALCESHHTVGTEKTKNKHTWSTSRVRTENLGWKFIRHLLIKFTETTNHNFYSRISGSLSFGWMLLYPYQCRADKRLALKQQPPNSTLGCSCLRWAGENYSLSRSSAGTYLEYLTLNLALSFLCAALKSNISSK